MQPEQLLTPDDVSRLLRISRQMLGKMVSEGRFPKPIVLGRKTLRWPASTVAAYIRHGAERRR